MNATLSERGRAQVALVEEHVRRENAHDLPGIMATFGRRAGMTTSHGVSTTRGETRFRDITKTSSSRFPIFASTSRVGWYPTTVWPSRSAPAARTSARGVVSLRPADRSPSRCADSTRSMKTASSPASAFTMIEGTSSSRSGSSAIRNHCSDAWKYSSRIR